MVDEQDAEEETTTTTSLQNSAAIDDHYLDLSLALRPLNFPSSQNVLETSNGHMTWKREQQAIRRRQAKVKRDLKRKQNGVVSVDELSARPQRRRTWWGNAGGGLCRGYNGNFVVVGGDENRSSVSSATSSAVSGGNSSDTSSHSGQHHTHSPATNLLTQSSTLTQPTSPQPRHTPSNSSNHNLPQPQLHSSSSNQTRLFTNSNQPSKLPTNEAKVAIGKPPKPNGQVKSQENGRIIPQMPCVTTTGNGPKGRTITGFLYKYTNTEVSIACVCHGTSFSPAGFVEHAGGVDVEHPLKHIRVVPFPLS
ncbi:hypothetical protein RND81_04G103700 [Saponaria officinalis]|uniref:Ninja-family protein n=1 Tax=Saponaria officinalis TaxID=3572 RepID=A0AAW1LLL6_SAPOF